MRRIPPGRLGPGRGARGFTVVEVLVGLVVLMIGVYAMIRIFPRSYIAVEASQMRTTASQLAEAKLAYWKLHPESLPDEIVATDYEGNMIESTQIGTSSDANGTGTLAPLLVTAQANTSLLPGSTTYEVPVITGDLFLNLGQVAGAIYNPADLTPSQVNAVSGLPDPSTRRPQLVANPDWQPNSMYLPRTIIGEQVDIRRLTTTASGIPFHLLSQAPLDVLRYEDDPSTTNVVEQNIVYVDVYDARPWQYVPSGSRPTPRLEQREFTYNATAERLEFGPRGDDGVSLEIHDRHFKVDYTAFGRLRRLVRIFGETVEVPANTGQAASALSRPLADPQTARVYEKLIPATTLDDLLVVSGEARRNIYWVDSQTEITGAISFPLVLLVDPQPTDITIVKVDYRVKDWQILSFDVQVPPSRLGVVELPIKGIKSSSFINLPRQPRPQPVAKGIRVLYKPDKTIDARPASDPVTWAFVVAVDRQNGEVLTERIVSAYPDNPYMRRTSLPKVNYREGRIQFNYYAVKHADGTYEPDPNEVRGRYVAGVDTPDRSGRTYRIYCRTESDWAVQLMMAARLYGRATTGLPGGPPAGATGAMISYAWNPLVDARQLYFPLSEAAHTVAVDYYDQNGNFVDGEPHTVGAATLVRFPGGTGGTDAYAWVCPLVIPLRPPGPNEFGPITVRGVSLRARGAWMSSGRRATLQDVAAAVKQATGASVRPPRKTLEETWHQVLIDSYVTRTPI